MVVSSSQTQNDMTARFCPLLQPIRDLTKNWDVDIAKNLEEYLEELETITVAFDGGLVTMNFAEAAMVIQGSACVYSKKVEYLYTLVHQVLDLLANKKKQAKTLSIDDDGNDRDAEFDDKHGDEEFLSLDDIQEHKNIQIKEDEYGCKSVMPIPQMPLCLIPLEEGEKGDNPLLSKMGEVLASRNDFRMNTCSVHQSGILLLDMFHLTLLDKSINMASDTVQDRDLNPINSEPVSLPPEDVPMDEPAEDDHDQMFDVPADEVDGAPVESNTLPETESLCTEQNADPVELRRSERKAKTVRLIPPKPLIDVWEPMDPHEANTFKEKAFKRGKMFKIPECVQDVSNKKRKRKTPKKTRIQPLTEYLTEKISNKSSFPRNPLKVPVFSEFEQLYWKEFKRRQSLLKNERKLMSKEVLEEVQQDEELEKENYCENEDMGLGGLDEGDDIDNDAPLVDDNLFNAIESAWSDRSTGITDHSNPDTPKLDIGVIVTDYEELVRQHVEQYMASAQEYAQITELSKRVAEWEDKVIPKLQEEDNHELFDINRYGTKVIDCLFKGKIVPFKSVTSTKPSFEISRIFLATLMLANTENVKIVQKGTLQDGMDMFELELLSTTRMFEQLEEYQAPSLACTS